MGLEKLKIEYERSANVYGQIHALFNPEKYTLTKAAQYAEIGIPGLDTPVLQFVRGQNEKIAMELFFDTTEFGMAGSVKDVRTESGKIYHLLKINSDTHVPPRCRLFWGDQLFSFGSSISPRCVLESVTEEFLLFSPEGVPLRAKLAVSFREYKTVEEQLVEIPRHSPDRTHVVKVDTRHYLGLIAYDQYGSCVSWRDIADANDLENPRHLKPQDRLVIPRLSPGKS